MAQETNPTKILVGHSAGAVVALEYLKDCPQDKFFEKAFLFNCTLIYPYPSLPSLCNFCEGTNTITESTLLVMSSNDPIMSWSLGLLTMWDAVDTVQEADKNVTVRVLDIPGYAHSPFAPTDVAWEVIMGNIPPPVAMGTLVMTLDYTGSFSSFFNINNPSTIYPEIVQYANTLRQQYPKLPVFTTNDIAIAIKEWTQ
jgi:pimeloyl-ACP methyl ester carboxylesterase